ncbi:hypothetical protein SteCoe_20324 [Stentor coeruleus]|uniref:Uncharacterized protein n=1 Tax=Stentor coeruleus TaxID=5963 RepID=A0A1R2BST5_9CILI|nr:hypothetical protein SteCoe_20324 [Stentor coeruleus]
MEHPKNDRNHLKVSLTKPLMKCLAKSPSHIKSALSEYSNTLTKLNKSANCSPSHQLGRNRNPIKSKHMTVAYNDWDYFSANKEPIKDLYKPLHELRRNLKNPHIYVTSIDMDDEQKIVEKHLFRAFQSIHRDE